MAQITRPLLGGLLLPAFLKLLPALNAQLGIGPVEVPFNGANRHMEFRCNFTVGQATNSQFHNVFLATREEGQVIGFAGVCP